MFFTQFKLRSLFLVMMLLVMTITAIFANPIYKYSVSVLRSWNQSADRKVVVSVPKGGIVIMGGRTYHVDERKFQTSFWTQPWDDSLGNPQNWLGNESQNR